MIIKDFEAPTINIYSPTAGEVFGNSTPSFSVRITDDYLDAMWYTLDGGLHNYTFTTNGTFEQAAWNDLDDGIVILGFYASDDLGHIGSVVISTIKDTIASGYYHKFAQRRREI
ncbi:MAG: hypothetical protein HWN81_03415 [Candidatus Lokiarchaeota archaeon]|nr:hypothetical protein [Candidatus Lokiarchaeota archaeon]